MIRSSRLAHVAHGILVAATLAGCETSPRPAPPAPTPTAIVRWTQIGIVPQHYDLHIRSYNNGSNTPGHSWMSVRGLSATDTVQRAAISDTRLVGVYKLILTAVYDGNEQTSDRVVVDLTGVESFLLNKRANERGVE